MSATSSHRTRRRRRLAALGAALSLALVAACGGDDGGNVVANAYDDGSLPTQTVATTLPSVAGQPCVEATDVPEAEGKPEVEMPVGETPTELGITDITEGDGPAAELGQTIKVHYVGIACSTGKQFDASWDRGPDPTEFPLTEGGLIKGWTDGIPGMKVGGRRMLVIPSDLAYGETGQPPDIAPDEALVFVIDLVDATDPPAEGTTGEEPAGDEPAGDEPGGEDPALDDPEAPTDDAPPADDTAG